jgi:TRAP-type C4-dicarboxylate transport system permease small subunit
MERLKKILTVLITCVITAYTFNTVIRYTGYISDGLSKICIVSVVLIGSWICSGEEGS